MNLVGCQRWAMFTVEQTIGKVRFAYTWSGAGEEDQAAKVRGTLVAEGSGGVDQGSDAIGLDSTTDKGRTPGSGSAGGLLGFEEFFLGVGGLSTVVCVTEDRAKDRKRDSVAVDGPKSDRARLHRWQICEREAVSVNETYYDDADRVKAEQRMEVVAMYQPNRTGCRRQPDWSPMSSPAPGGFKCDETAENLQ